MGSGASFRFFQQVKAGPCFLQKPCPGPSLPPLPLSSRIWPLHFCLLLSNCQVLSGLHPPSCSILTATLGGATIFPALEEKLRHREGERLA